MPQFGTSRQNLIFMFCTGQELATQSVDIQLQAVNGKSTDSCSAEALPNVCSLLKKTCR